MNIILEDGKYEYHCKDGEQYALRNGEPWRDLTGDKFIYCMAARIGQLERQRDELLAALDQVSATRNIGSAHIIAREAIANAKEKQCK